MSVNIDELINEIQTRGFNVERVRQFVAEASAEQMDSIGFNGMTVLFILPRLGMIMRSAEDAETLGQWTRTALERGANPNLRNSRGMTPLIAAATISPRMGDMIFFKMLDALTEFGADVNARDDNGRTAAFVVASRESPNERNSHLTALVNKGANLNIQTNEGKTPLMALIDLDERGSYNIMVMSIIALPSIDLTLADNLGQTALMKACKNANGSVVNQLVNSGKDIGLDQQDNNGNTALMIVSGLFNAEDQDMIVETLVNEGADKTIQNNQGQTAYDIMKDANPRSNVLSLLVDYSVNARPSRARSHTRPPSVDMTGTPRRISIPSPVVDSQPTTDDGETGEDDEGWVNARPLPRIQVAPTANTGQRRRLPWEVNPPRGRTTTPSSTRRRRRRDEDADDEDVPATRRQVRRDIKINVNQAVDWFDPIMQEEEKGVVIKERLAENPANIVIAYGPNFSNFYFTDRNVIASQAPDATFYPCKVTDTMRPTNIVRSKPLYDFKMIGLIEGSFCDASALRKKPNHQVFAIAETGKTYPSFVSEAVLNRGASFVSGLHCQAGQERRVSELVAATPVEEALGGGRKTRKHGRKGGKAVKGGKRRTHKKIGSKVGKKPAKTGGRKTRKVMKHKRVHRK
jgi:ankyrin repeat protein